MAYKITIPIEVLLQDIVKEANEGLTLIEQNTGHPAKFVMQKLSELSNQALRGGLIVRLIIGPADLRQMGNIARIMHLPVVVMNAIPQIAFEDDTRGELVFVKDDLSQRKVTSLELLYARSNRLRV